MVMDESWVGDALLDSEVAAQVADSLVKVFKYGRAKLFPANINSADAEDLTEIFRVIREALLPMAEKQHRDDNPVISDQDAQDAAFIQRYAE